MLKLKAIATAKTEAQTDVAPLSPQSQGVRSAALPEASFIPIGNAIPMKKPSGKRTPIAARIRTFVIDP